MNSSGWQTYDLTVDGYRFRVKITPGRTRVDWVDCPSVYLPSGYSSVAYIAAEPDRTDSADSQSQPSVPSEDEMREEIRHWLSGLEDLDDLDD